MQTSWRLLLVFAVLFAAVFFCDSVLIRKLSLVKVYAHPEGAFSAVTRVVGQTVNDMLAQEEAEALLTAAVDSPERIERSVKLVEILERRIKESRGRDSLLAEQLERKRLSILKAAIEIPVDLPETLNLSLKLADVMAIRNDRDCFEQTSRVIIKQAKANPHESSAANALAQAAKLAETGGLLQSAIALKEELALCRPDEPALLQSLAKLYEKTGQAESKAKAESRLCALKKRLSSESTIKQSLMKAKAELEKGNLADAQNTINSLDLSAADFSLALKVRADWSELLLDKQIYDIAKPLCIMFLESQVDAARNGNKIDKPVNSALYLYKCLGCARATKDYTMSALLAEAAKSMCPNFASYFAGEAWALSGETNASPKPIYTIANKPNAKIDIDGRDTDEVWISIAEIPAPYTLFCYPNYPEKKVLALERAVEREPRVKIFHDQEYFYLYAYCPEPNMDSVMAKRLDGDMGIWRDDCIEFFIVPDRDLYRYSQAIINAKGKSLFLKKEGITFDDVSISVGGKVNAALSLEATISSSNDKGGWSVEAKFPLAAMGGDKQESNNLHLGNFRRMKWVEGTKAYLWSWSPGVHVSHAQFMMNFMRVE